MSKLLAGVALMSDTTQTAMPRRGAFYLVALGAIGVFMAVYFVIEGFAELWEARWQAGFISLVVGAVFGAASARVLKSWRDLRSLTKRD
jgi:hypothetical protein